ncbi:MAG: hypothetical protein P9L88_05330 [Candidatus Tantalella remota]|nr:hypothetical protein [Candidatus Tantalella remota]
MKVLAIMLVAFMALSTVTCFAVEREDPITGSVKTVGRAAKGTVETAVSPVVAIGRGEPEKVITDPLNKGGKTVYDATVDTGKTVTMQKVDSID